MKTMRIILVIVTGLLSISLVAVVKSEAAEESASNPEGSNLISRPGFEASGVSLRAKWRFRKAGCEIDREEKHTGNQSIKLVVAERSITTGVGCSLPAAKIKTPGSIIVSGWSKAENVSGGKDSNYSIYIDVRYADDTYLYGKTAQFNTGTHGWEYSSVIIKLAKPVKSFRISLLLRGGHTGTVWFDDIYAGEYKEGMARYEGSPFGYTIPARVKEARRKVALFKEKISILEDLIKKAESKEIDVSLQRVSLATAKLFTGFIPGDAALEIEDCPSRARDLRILGREELAKRLQGLSDFEIRQTESILDKAINEVEKIIKNPSLQVRIPPSKIRNISAKNGVFYSGNEPVFISGIHALAYITITENIDVLKELGANLLGPLHIHQNSSKSWDKFDDSYFKNTIFPEYKLAGEKGFLVNPGMWDYAAPGWLAKIAPDIDVEKGKGWFRSSIDIDHPLTQRFKTSWFKYATSQLKNIPNNFCYSLMGEERCSPDFRSKYTAKRYENWLEEKYQDIDGLNKAWGTDYKDFKEPADKKSLETKGGHYDWHRFNQYRLTTFNQWQIDGIKKEDPQALYTCWPPGGGLVSTLIGSHFSRLGVNWENIINQCSVVGWDGAIIPCEVKERKSVMAHAQADKYNLGWRAEIIYYDIAKSIAPNKPIFDPEWHTIASFKHLSPLGISPDFLRTALWMQHLHGLGAHLAWLWGRKADGTPHWWEFLGGLLTQPQLLESWGRTVLELRRLTEYIVLFPQLERRVRILYSEPSCIQDGRVYADELSEVYEALYFLDYPAGFITEKMIREGKLRDCSLLVIPNARYVNEEAVAGIREYQRKKGRVIIIGKESLKYDEYGKERDISNFLKEEDIYLAGSTAEEYSAQLDNILDELGIKRPVRLLDKEGKNAWGIELRTAYKDGRKIVYLINLNRHNAEVVLKAEKRIRKVKDLIDNKVIELNCPFILEPRKPMLLEMG